MEKKISNLVKVLALSLVVLNHVIIAKSVQTNNNVMSDDQLHNNKMIWKIFNGIAISENNEIYELVISMPNYQYLDKHMPLHIEQPNNELRIVSPLWKMYKLDSTFKRSSNHSLAKGGLKYKAINQGNERTCSIILYDKNNSEKNVIINLPKEKSLIEGEKVQLTEINVKGTFKINKIKSLAVKISSRSELSSVKDLAYLYQLAQ